MSETPPGNASDFLYIIAGGKFFRLQPTDVQAKGHEILDTGKDHELFETLKDLQKRGVVVADLPGPDAGPAASCICIALNLDVFEPSIKAKADATRRILEAGAAEKPQK
jgi:hypothetical protein